MEASVFLMLNENVMAMMPWRGYEEGDKLAEASSCMFDGVDVEEIAEKAFRFWNRGFDYSHRSASVGDVLVMSMSDAVIAVAIEATGFRRIA